MLYGDDLQSSCERKREISQRMTKRDEKKKLCALLSVHESTAIGISCRHASRGMEALHREEGKQGMHQQNSTEESPRQAGRKEGLQRENPGWTEMSVFEISRRNICKL